MSATRSNPKRSTQSTASGCTCWSTKWKHADNAQRKAYYQYQLGNALFMLKKYDRPSNFRGL